MRLITTGFELQKSFMLAVGLYKQMKEKNLVFQTQARKKGQMLTHSTYNTHLNVTATPCLPCTVFKRNWLLHNRESSTRRKTASAFVSEWVTGQTNAVVPAVQQPRVQEKRASKRASSLAQ